MYVKVNVVYIMVYAENICMYVKVNAVYIIMVYAENICMFVKVNVVYIHYGICRAYMYVFKSEC